MMDDVDQEKSEEFEESEESEERETLRVVDLLRYVEVLLVIAAVGFLVRQAFWTSAETELPVGVPVVAVDFETVTELATPQDRWDNPGGQWASDGTSALLAVPSPFGPALLLTQAESPVSGISARFEKVGEGAGLAFRAIDDQNYMALIAAPEFQSWALLRVVGGQAFQIADSGISSVADGTTAGVRLEGERIYIEIDGAVKGEVVDPTFQNAQLAGLLLRGGGDQTTRWDNVVLYTGGAGS